jgi:hypothetical protein
MPKFLGNLRVIVEAEDWNEAFDYLAELLSGNPSIEFSYQDGKIVSSSIDKLEQTKRRYVTDRPTQASVRRLVRRELAKKE